MSAVAFRGFVSGMPPFICGVLISLLVFSWTGQTSVSSARSPEGLGEAYLGRKVDDLTGALANTEQKLAEERRLIGNLKRKLRDASLDRRVDNLSSTLANTERKLAEERRLVRHLKRELRDASLQIDVFSQLRRASGESSDPIWPSTAIAATEETGVLAPYVVGAQTLVGARAVSLFNKTTTSARKSPYSPRKLRKASKPRKMRTVRRERPALLHAPKRVVASVRAAKPGTRNTAGASNEQARPTLQKTARNGIATPRKARKSRTRAVRRLARPARLGRLSRRQRYSARRRSKVSRSGGSFFNRVARRGVFGDAYTIH